MTKVYIGIASAAVLISIILIGYASWSKPEDKKPSIPTPRATTDISETWLTSAELESIKSERIQLLSPKAVSVTVASTTSPTIKVPPIIPKKTPTIVNTANKPLVRVVTSTAVKPTSTPTVTTPPKTENVSQVITLKGSKFCNYSAGLSAVIISGYPMILDMIVPDSHMLSWEDKKVSFILPDEIPPGTYIVTVRGYGAYGYCNDVKVGTITIK